MQKRYLEKEKYRYSKGNKSFNKVSNTYVNDKVVLNSLY
jgi:hypothetical protein